MLKFLVKNQKIEILEREVIASDQISFVTLKFTFDGDWKKFYKVVQFTQCDETYNRVLGFDGLSCLLPAELHAGAVKMSVFGYDADNTSGLRATTVPVTLNIRQSGFVGDDDSPIPPTPDLYTQILQKIEEITGKGGTVPDMSEYPKKDEIQKMIEQALTNSETVIPSDYVTIQRLNDEILMIREAITPIRMDAHSHKNKDILDNTTASYTLEEQKKLAELNLSDYVTVRKLNDEILMVHEAITPIRENSHTHKNKELLDSLTADSLALLPDLQQFEDVTKYDIQTIKESLAPVVRQAHFHENLAVLDGITADRIKKWDSISTLQTQLNGLSTELTVWKNKCSSNSDRLHANEATIDNIISELDEIQEKIKNFPNFDIIQETLKAMQAEIDSSGSNIQTIFQGGTDALEKYGETTYTFYNNGYRSLSGFVQAYPNFCSAENDYALYYSQSDFSWAGTVYTMILQPFSISKNSGIVLTYQSGASAVGELYLMRKISGRTYAELAQVVYEQIQSGNAVRLEFQWLQSNDFISVLVDCTDVAVGQYYLVWKGVSDNTHPKIKAIKVLGG